MGQRTLEISKPSELHVSACQLVIEQENKKISIPLEDLATIVCLGSNIRISTMALSLLSKNGIVLQILDEKYRLTSLCQSIEGNSQQALIMRRQVSLDSKKACSLWKKIVERKITNQSRALALLGIEGSEKVEGYASKAIKEDDLVDQYEAAAARQYFSNFHPGLNRKNDDPMNSHLNYGYAIVRNAIIRALINSGFQPAFGIHHSNQFNAFNLADDLIEPWRPMVDLVAHGNIDSKNILTKSQRKNLSMVLHHACLINGNRYSVLEGIDIMVQSLKKAVLLDEYDELHLPTIIPIEVIEVVSE